MSYGNCPICGARGISRERRLNGNDVCENGHKYPSSEAVLYKETKSVEKLAPCPFCGNKNVYIEEIFSYNNYGKIKSLLFVKCERDNIGGISNNCDCEGPKYLERDKAIEQWNKVAIAAASIEKYKND